MYNRLNGETLRQVLTTVDVLYEAACNPEKWPAFLRSAADTLNAKGAQIGHHDLGNHSLSFSRVHGYDRSEDHYRRYDELMPTDPRIPHFAANPFQPVHCRMHLSDSDLRATRVYQDVLSPGGVEYTLGVNLKEDTRSLSYFLALRGADQPAFARQDCDILQELIPHLNRAIQLQRDLSSIDFERKIAASTLDNMAVGLIVVDRGAKILFSNSTARSILAENDGLSDLGARVVADDLNGRTLNYAIERVVTQAQIGKTSGQPVTIQRRRADDPLQVFVSPLADGHKESGWANISEPLAVLVLRDPVRPVETRQELLCKSYGLTASQSNLVTLIVGGLSLKRAAGEAGLTEASARQYLKIVFEKMNVSRQGEMVAKVLNLPLPVQTPEA